jgi:hypothetical protein
VTRGDAGARFRIVLGEAQQKADPPHTLGLLREGSKRPNRCDAAHQTDKLASSHLTPQRKYRAQCLNYSSRG